MTTADPLRALLDEAISDIADSVATWDMSCLFPAVPSLFTKGAQIGPYTLIRLLGHGGFGEVWWAEQHQPICRPVALKLIRPGMDTVAVLRRFQLERQVLAAMEHPHVATLLDAGTTPDGRPYFAMELVRDGLPITTYCKEKRLGLPERLQLFQQVCSAVQHAHQKAIIHRDLKPSNILVTTMADGRPQAKVIDFGIAKLLSADMHGVTQTLEHEQLPGTPVYMAPEQLDARLAPDTRTDVYALGVILYELLIGRTPLDPETLRRAHFQLLQKLIFEQETPRPSLALAMLPDDTAQTLATALRQPLPRYRRVLARELDWIILKALAPEPARRYASPDQLAADIACHLGNEPVLARPPSLAYRATKLLRKHWQLTVATAVFLLTITSFAAAYYRTLQAELAVGKARLAASAFQGLVNVQTTADETTRRLAIQRELRQLPPDLQAYALAGKLAFSLGYLDQAQEIAEHGISIGNGESPPSTFAAEMHYLHGLALTQNGQPEAGEHERATALESIAAHLKSPTTSEAKTVIARLLSFIVIALGPVDAEAHHDLAATLLADRVSIMKMAQAPGCEIATQLSQLAWHSLFQKDFSSAQKLAREAYQLDPNNAQCALKLGHTLLLAEDPAEAQKHYRESQQKWSLEANGGLPWQTLVMFELGSIKHIGVASIVISNAVQNFGREQPGSDTAAQAQHAMMRFQELGYHLLPSLHPTDLSKQGVSYTLPVRKGDDYVVLLASNAGAGSELLVKDNVNNLISSDTRAGDDKWVEFSASYTGVANLIVRFASGQTADFTLLAGTQPFSSGTNIITSDKLMELLIETLTSFDDQLRAEPEQKLRYAWPQAFVSFNDTDKTAVNTWLDNLLAKQYEPAERDLKTIHFLWSRLPAINSQRDQYQAFASACEAARDQATSAIQRERLLSTQIIFAKLLATDTATLAALQGARSWERLFSKNHAGALSDAEQGLQLDPKQTWIAANLAHAYLFAGQLTEAKAAYLKYQGQGIGSDQSPWEEVIADDFREFQEVGIAPAQMQEIEALLALPEKGAK